jgi:hypothetical protein
VLSGSAAGGTAADAPARPVAGKPAQTCGTIAGALNGANEANIGKPIIWDMVPDAKKATRSI